MKTTHLTTAELAERIKYDARTIRNQLKDSVLLEGIHYIRPFGGRKILYLWEKIEVDMFIYYNRYNVYKNASQAAIQKWHSPRHGQNLLIFPQ